MSRPQRNEEEVKIKYVLPLLAGLGFDILSELRFEYAFPHEAEGDRRSTFADIVVFRQGRAVLVIEVKAEGVDVRGKAPLGQAVRYARAHETVIPYAIVTNGRDCILVDTLMAQPITASRALFNTEVEFLLRSEVLLKQQAMRLIGGPDPSDFMEWTAEQRARTIGSLAGVGSDSPLIVDRKYLSGLYSPRRSLDRAFERFLASPKRVFAVVGDAGLGKTTYLCDLATRLGINHAVLFYHGAEISSTWEHLLLADLSPSLFVKNLPDAISRIASRTPFDGTTFIFLDAINECSGDRDAIRNELNVCGQALEGLPVRVVISCRTMDWDFWTRNRRWMSGSLARAVYSETTDPDPAVRIGRFDDEEFRVAWELYRDRFALNGHLSNQMRDLCREPFMLRLLAEVYRDGRTIPEFVEPIELFGRYWDEKFPEGVAEIRAVSFLDWMAQRIIDTDKATVPLADVATKDLDACLQLLDENVLVRRVASSITFRFELFLEFVLANHILGTFDEQSTEAQRQQVISDLVSSNLVNMPGVVENILLTWRDNEQLLDICLQTLCSLDDRWKVISCSVLRKLGAGAGSWSVVDLLARSSNHVVRTFLGESLSWSDRLPDVVRLAGSEDSWESRETAAVAAGRLGRVDTVIIDMLSRLSEDYHWRVRRSTGYAMKSLWGGNTEVARDWMALTLSGLGEASWRHKYTLCSALVGTRLDEESAASAAVARLATDPNPQVRWGIANYLLRYEQPWAHPAVNSLLQDSDPWVRARLANSLMARQSDQESMRKLLTTLAADTAAPVRLKVAREISVLSDRAFVIDILKALCEDRDADVHFAAAYSLSALGDGSAADDLVTSAEDVMRILRERIARRDADPAAGISAAGYEYVLRRSELRSELRSHAESYMAVIDAMSSLIAVALTAVPDRRPSLKTLLELLCQDKDEGVRWGVVAFLVRYAGDQIPLSLRLSTLEALARDSHWWVRREVAIGLGEQAELFQSAGAATILSAVVAHEESYFEPCSDEVLHFARMSMTRMEAAQSMVS